MGVRAGDRPAPHRDPRQHSALGAEAAAPYERDRTVVELFERVVDERPDALAVLDGPRATSYGELDRAANRVAHELLHRGLLPEGAVGIAMERSLQAVAALIGTLKAGGMYVPIDRHYPSERLRLMLADTRAAIVLSDAAAEADLRAVDVSPIVLDAELSALRMRPSNRPPHRASALDIAYVMYTSGSTGRPKGVEIPHRGILRLVRGTNFIELDEDTVMLALGPLSFDPSTLEIRGPLLNGGAIAIHPPGRASAATIGAAIRRHGATAALLVSGLLQQIADEDIDQLRGLRQLLTGGDVVSPAHARRIVAALGGCRLVNLYGPTESTLCATFHVVGSLADGEPVPIGRPIAHTTIHLLDEDGVAVQPGEVGEIHIGGDGLARGYVGDAELTSARFVPDMISTRPGGRLYRSGDLARERADGELEFLGRRDEQVKIRGYRVEPGEVESHLSAHPAILAAAVVPREDLPGHKRLVAYVVARTDAPPSPAAIRAFLQSRLPEHMIPSAFVALERLPLTATGKLDRAALPAPDARRRAPDPASLEPPRDATERTVAAIWMEVLRLDEVGRGEDFFELGGDSLLATLVLARLRERACGGEVSLEALFREPTVAALAAGVRSGAGRPQSPSLPPLEPDPPEGEAPLAPSQRPAWYFQHLEPASVAYQFQARITLLGTVDVGALERAMGRLIDRHEILRTTFAAGSEGPVQRVHAAMPVPLELLDLADRCDGEREAALARAERERFTSPFDPGRLPLLRWTLARLAPEHHVLLHVEHHLIHDGWSFNLLVGELAALYRLESGAEGPEPAPPTLQFGHFASWQSQLLQSELAAAQLAYWSKRLSGLPALDLLRGRPREGGGGLRGDMVRLPLSAELADRLRNLAGEEGATLFMVMLAAFALLLRRYSGQKDFAIGSGVANRRLPASMGMLGMVVNTVAIRLEELPPGATVRDLIAATRDAALGAFANQDLPFERLVEATGPERVRDRLPLCQVLFSFHDSPAPELDLPGLEVSIEGGLPNGSAKADLNVVVVRQQGNPLTLLWEYDAAAFEREGAERMVRHYVGLLEQLDADPDRELRTLELLDDEVPAERRAGLSGPETAYERDGTVPEVFAARAAEAPERVAVSFEGQSLTYAQLDRRANRLAHRLIALGVRRGDRVGVAMDRSPELLLAMLAVMKAGACYAPLDPSDPPARLQALVELLDVSLLLSLGRHRDRLPGPADRLLCLDDEVDLSREPDLPPASVARPLDPAYVMFTSGSTGAPKGVEVPHRAVLRLVRGADYVELGPEETLLGFSPAAFDASTFEIWGALLNGGRLALAPPGPLTLAELEEVIAREGVSTMFITTGLFNRIVDERPALLAGVRQLLTGGDVASPEHLRRALLALGEGAVLVNGYGPTEATTFTCAHAIHPGAEVPAPVPIGRPIANTRVLILDPAGRPAPVGVVGELCIGGDGLALGYLGEPALTAERFIADPVAVDPAARLYRSGDLAVRRLDGTIDFLGRTDRQLKLRGFRVEPGEIEEALRCHAGVADALVAPFQRDGGERELAAYVVPGGGPPPAPAELRAHLARHLPAHSIPSLWSLLDRLPLTANGKVDAAALPEPARVVAGGQPGGRAAGVPEDPLAARLLAVWERVLGRQGIAPDDDFFELGGHSLLAVELFAGIERSLGVSLPLASIFDAPTPRRLAALLRAEGWDGSRRSLVALRAGGTRRAMFFVTAGDGNAVGYGALARRLGSEQPFYALQPRGLNGRARMDDTVEAMAGHHLRELRRVQPRGPYLLGGRCLGGLIAYEMARRLLGRGERVELLAVLDSGGPLWQTRRLADGTPFDEVMNSAHMRGESGVERSELFTPDGTRALLEWLGEPVLEGAEGTVVNRYLDEVYRLREDVREIYRDLEGEDALWFVGWAWTQGRAQMGLADRLLPPPHDPSWREPMGRGDGGALARARVRLSWRAAELLDLVSRERRPEAGARRGERIREAGLRAWYAYRAKPYAGVVTVIRSQERPMRPLLKRWHALDTAGVREPFVAGTHRSMLREPDVGTLAECLSELVADATR